MVYAEDDFLMISGIQHFCFCRRQWALIHVEQQWRENVKTIEGKIVHKNCHDKDFYEKRKDKLITRSLRIFSRELGVTGQCDVVEFMQKSEGALLQGHFGLWQPYPIEYKRGKSKSIDADRLQLCCQAMCLEEMLSFPIKVGAIFYAETHRREEIILSEILRNKVMDMLLEMHNYMKRGYTPKTKPKVGCKACSLNTVCVPSLCGHSSVNNYYAHYLNGEEV